MKSGYRHDKKKGRILGSLIILHSTIDTVQVQVLAGLAADDLDQTGLTPWVDAPNTATRGVETLGGHEPLDPQIADKVENADAILYIVGGTGLGRYQSAIESELVRETIERRKAAGNPIKFIPVLLRDGSAADLPDWMRAYTVVNMDHSLQRLPALWDAIKQRLAAGPELPAAAQPKAAPEWEAHVRTIIDSVRARNQLTVFIGPYSAENPGGPTAAARHLLADALRLAGIASDDSAQIVPWPSEAAQWALLPEHSDSIREKWRRLLAPIGRAPPDLTLRIGDLAEKWMEIYGERPADEADWNGLLLLTTRTDLAIENVLSAKSKVDFTRILPSLNSSREQSLRRKSVQQWTVRHGWDGDATEAGAPRRDVGPADVGGLSSFPIDEVARRVVLVKLCGSVEVPDSLVLSAGEIFTQAQNLQSLPTRLVDVIGNSAQLIIGRGFASPLAQLIQLSVLKPSPRPRLWVVSGKPEADDGPEDIVDALCDLELKLLDTCQDKVKEALNVNHIYRGPEAKFVRHLAEALY